MNRERRRRIQKIIDRLEELQHDLSVISEEEQEAYDNMPENLMETEKGEKAQEYIDNLEYATDNIEDLIDNLNNAIQ